MKQIIASVFLYFIGSETFLLLVTYVFPSGIYPLTLGAYINIYYKLAY